MIGNRNFNVARSTSPSGIKTFRQLCTLAPMPRINASLLLDAYDKIIKGLASPDIVWGNQTRPIDLSHR